MLIKEIVIRLLQKANLHLVEMCSFALIGVIIESLLGNNHENFVIFSINKVKVLFLMNKPLDAIRIYSEIQPKLESHFGKENIWYKKNFLEGFKIEVTNDLQNGTLPNLVQTTNLPPLSDFKGIT